MKRMIPLAVLLGLLCLLSAPAADEKKTDKPEKLVPAGQIFGRLHVGKQGGKKQQATNYSVQGTRKQNIDLDLGDEVKIRLTQPPNKFDDKGNPKKHTSQELRELKGKGNLWGYTGDVNDLKNGQLVEVFLGKKREAGSKPVVTMIYILGEGADEPRKRK